MDQRVYNGAEALSRPRAFNNKGTFDQNRKAKEPAWAAVQAAFAGQPPPAFVQAELFQRKRIFYTHQFQKISSPFLVFLSHEWTSYRRWSFTRKELVVYLQSSITLKYHSFKLVFSNAA